METPILQVSNINKSFGRVLALRDVSFSVARGSIIGLVWHSTVLAQCTQAVT